MCRDTTLDRAVNRSADLTQRTRGDPPQSLFTKDDIRKLIDQADLKLTVTPEAIRWLQSRASTLGMGGVGKALVCICLAYKMAFVQGMDYIGVEHRDAVQNLSMGHEDAKHMADVVSESATMRRVV